MPSLNKRANQTMACEHVIKIIKPTIQLKFGVVNKTKTKKSTRVQSQHVDVSASEKRNFSLQSARERQKLSRIVFVLTVAIAHAKTFGAFLEKT